MLAFFPSLTDGSIAKSNFLTRNRGQSPLGVVAECLLFSGADGGFDSEIERFEGFCPVAPSPFATLSMIHRWWRFAYHRLMARIPPGLRYGMRRERDNPLNPFCKHFQPRIGKIGPIGHKPAERLCARGEVMFPSLGSR